MYADAKLDLLLLLPIEGGRDGVLGCTICRTGRLSIKEKQIDFSANYIAHADSGLYVYDSYGFGCCIGIGIFMRIGAE